MTDNLDVLNWCNIDFETCVEKLIDNKLEVGSYESFIWVIQ